MSLRQLYGPNDPIKQLCHNFQVKLVKIKRSKYDYKLMEIPLFSTYPNPLFEIIIYEGIADKQSNRYGYYYLKR